MYVLVYQRYNIVTLFAAPTTCLYRHVDDDAISYTRQHWWGQL